MLDDPSQSASQDEQAKTKLFLPAPPTTITSITAPHTTMVHHSGITPTKQEVRLPLAMILLSLIGITALVLGVLFAVVPLLAQQKHSANTTSPPTQVANASANTPPAANATQASVQGTATIQGVSILPTHFTVQSDCQVDNGYRCTITLFAAQNISDDLQWQASSDGITTKFSPPNGSIGQGQQQQVIVYIYDPCPYNGTLLFSIGNDNLTVPVNC